MADRKNSSALLGGLQQQRCAVWPLPFIPNCSTSRAAAPTCRRDLFIELHFGPRRYVDPEPFANSLQLNHAIQQVGALGPGSSMDRHAVGLYSTLAAAAAADAAAATAGRLEATATAATAMDTAAAACTAAGRRHGCSARATAHSEHCHPGSTRASSACISCMVTANGQQHAAGCVSGCFSFNSGSTRAGGISRALDEQPASEGHIRAVC